VKPSKRTHAQSLSAFPTNVEVFADSRTRVPTKVDGAGSYLTRAGFVQALSQNFLPRVFNVEACFTRSPVIPTQLCVNFRPIIFEQVSPPHSLRLDLLSCGTHDIAVLSALVAISFCCLALDLLRRSAWKRSGRWRWAASARGLAFRACFPSRASVAHRSAYVHLILAGWADRTLGIIAVVGRGGRALFALTAGLASGFMISASRARFVGGTDIGPS